jgi:glutamate 5-kinase
MLPLVHEIDKMIEGMAGGTQSVTAVGGMATKIEAARVVMRAGIPMVIASGRKPDVLARILAAEEEGTLFLPRATRLKSRKRWLAFFHHPKGKLVVDEGAKRALREEGRSLLLPGVSHCEGAFAAGEVVRICDLNGTEFARGISRYSNDDITARRRTAPEVVHRDDLVIL